MPIEMLNHRPELPELELSHGNARLRLSLQGAHITQYVIDDDDLLWVSESARFEAGAAIRGGIPLCWPWFGASLDDSDWPQHGFARTGKFSLVSQATDDLGSSVVLELDQSAAVPAWRHAARLEVEIRLSDHLWMELRTTNTSDESILVGAGLHSYFSVASSSNVAIPALTGLSYLDKPTGYTRQLQREHLVVEGEIDRVYLEAPKGVVLEDPGKARSIAIDAWGNTDLVVWNPGTTVAAAMADFDDDGFERMICIEPAIALDRRFRLGPGETLAVGQTIRMEYL